MAKERTLPDTCDMFFNILQKKFNAPILLFTAEGEHTYLFTNMSSADMTFFSLIMQKRALDSVGAAVKYKGKKKNEGLHK